MYFDILIYFRFTVKPIRVVLHHAHPRDLCAVTAPALFHHAVQLQD